MASRPFYVRARNAWYLKYRPDPEGGWVKVKLCRHEGAPREGVTPRVPPEAAERAREYERIERAARDGTRVAPARVASLADFLAGYAASHALGSRPGTAEHLERGIRRFVDFAAARGVTSLRAVTGALCRDYLDDRARSVAASTLRSERGYLMGAWTRAVEDELIAANPWATARGRGKPAPWTYTYWDPREIERIADACARPWQSNLVLFLANTGLRIQTALAARWSWVDERAGTLRIEPGPNIKTAYTMSPSPLALTLIARWRAEAASPSPLIFPRDDSDRPYSYTTARDAIGRAIARAKVPPGTPHDIRHSYARTLVLSGMPVPVVQKQLGHTNLKMTMRYVSADDDQAARFLEGVDLGGGGVTGDPRGT